MTESEPAQRTAPDAAPAHAGVNFPPPFVYAAGILIGWLIGRAKSWPIALTWTARLAIGIAGIVVWLLIFGGASAAFRRKHTTLIPNKPATALATDGPYRFTRNPMYVSMVALYVGVAFLVGTWWSLLLLPIVILIIDRAVIAREERYLASAFPDEYSALRSRVRRWI